jgi:hypothetical protein
MSKYVAKQEVVIAKRWYRVGDADGVAEHRGNRALCSKCKQDASTHGWLIGRMELVCPGNWIIVDTLGAIFQMSDEVFFKKYEKVND